MKIFTEPEVFLIAEPHINFDGLGDFLKECGYPEAHETFKQEAAVVVELGGRMCFGSYKNFGKTGELVAKAVELGHGSIFEHANFTFAVARCSRGFTHQMVRHRAGFAYSQESTHYIKYSLDNARFCVEPYSYDTDEKRDVILNSLNGCVSAYEKLYDKLKTEEETKHNSCGAARQLLPNAIEAKILITANIRSWRHFCEERGNPHNTLEIRMVAIKIYDILWKRAKLFTHGLSKFMDIDGRESIKTINRKI